MDNTPLEQLVFVCNADSGVGNALLGSAHKILSPASYDCNLCAITFGVFSENKKWKEFRQNYGLEMEFLHRDEFRERFPNQNQDNQSFPKVFILKNGKLIGFLNKMEINTMKSQEDLILGIRKKYAQIISV